jgi:hypothetical protein
LNSLAASEIEPDPRRGSWRPRVRDSALLRSGHTGGTRCGRAAALRVEGEAWEDMKIDWRDGMGAIWSIPIPIPIPILKTNLICR